MATLALAAGSFGAGTRVAAPGAVRPATTATAAAGDQLVIVRPGTASEVAAAVVAEGGSIERRLATLDTLVVHGVSATALRRIHDVASVSQDATVSGRSDGWGSSSGSGSTTTTAANPTVGLPVAEDSIRARRLWGWTTGQGVDVALIDTGIAPVQGLTAPGKVINGPDLSFESQSDSLRYVDNNGHGTQMAGIIAANDFSGTGASPLLAGPNDVVGVAPDARLVNVKVGDGHGVADVSQVLAAIDWVVQHAHDPNGGPGGLNIRVLNLSYGTDSTQSAAIDPLAHAAEVAWRSGIVVVCAAGNNGDTAGRLADPAIDPYVLAVGAVDTGTSRYSYDDTVPAFSSRGDGVRNPDVVAPGVHIASLRAPGSTVDATFGATAGVGNRLLRGSGTSQSTAMVSGAAALLLSARPALTPDQVKAMLMGSARAVSGADPRAQGSGLIDVAHAAFMSTPDAVQNFPVSTGGGSLQAARGSHTIMLNAVPLTGEVDILGGAYDSPSMAAAEESQAAWSGGVWNGSSWAGSSWAGSSWAGSSWAGSSWAGYGWGDPAAPQQAASWAGAGGGDASWQ